MKYLLSLLLFALLIGCQDRSNEKDSKEVRKSQPDSADIDLRKSEIDTFQTRRPNTGASPNDKLAELDHLIEHYQLNDAIKLCEQLMTRDKVNAELWARKSIIWCKKAANEDGNKKERYIKQARRLAEEALTLAPENVTTNEAMARAYGMESTISGPRDKIALIQLANEHCHKILSIAPDHSFANYFVGRYYYELADMNKLLAVFAKSMIKEDLEKASYKLASQYLKRAVDQDATRFIYCYFLGLAYVKSEQKILGKQYLEKARTLKAFTKQEKELYQGLDKTIRKNT